MISAIFVPMSPRPDLVGQEADRDGDRRRRGPSSSLAAPGAMSPAAIAATVETHMSTISRISRRYSIADWTALKKAMKPLMTAMIPVGSSMLSSFATTLLTIVLHDPVRGRLEHRVPQVAELALRRTPTGR